MVEQTMLRSDPDADAAETRQPPEPSPQPVGIDVNAGTRGSGKHTPDDDMSLHRVKEAPVRSVEGFAEKAWSSCELSKFCFTQSEAEASSVFVRSKTLQDEADKVSDRRSGFTALREEVLKRTTSRVGRSNQRWEEDPETGIGYRLSTGTVPIMSDGRILFISSSRKQEWILPKGGWEMDETQEECALRETFEEAGVTGILGPKLTVVEYETRKANKRREVRENMEGSFRKIETPSSGVSVSTISDLNSEDDTTMAPEAVSYPPVSTGVTENVTIDSGSIHGNSDMETTGTGKTKKGTLEELVKDAAMSLDPAALCTHVRMTLYVLYVSEVRAEWPEQGRARKVFEINEAIPMLGSRPEFQAAVKEVKERKLHRVAHSQRSLVPSR